jgi:cytoplasmic iron level regulating protein YaaA (DUF328/UPF0246 family)
MKIILSPSKTQKPHTNTFYTSKDILFPTEHKKVLAALRKLTKSDIQNKMKLSKDLLVQTYSNIKNYNILDQFQAFDAFTGLVFFNMDRNSYQKEEHQYIEQNVRILDAFYGVLEPGTLIKPYRLDMKMPIGLNLYHHWNVSPYFKDEVIINLASNEFSKMLPAEHMITVSFLQNKDGRFVNQATYSKMARGKFADFMIKNKITQIDDLFSFQVDGYTYNQELSTNTIIVFTR